MRLLTKLREKKKNRRKRRPDEKKGDDREIRIWHQIALIRPNKIKSFVVVTVYIVRFLSLCLCFGSCT